MSLFHNFIVKFKNLIKPNETSKFHPESQVLEEDQQHVMSDEEKLDESIAESMIASDPPGHISKSAEDRNLH
jgi:hypothetical protein